MTNMTLERTLLALALRGFAATAAGQGSSPKRSVEIVVGGRLPNTT